MEEELQKTIAFYDAYAKEFEKNTKADRIWCNATLLHLKKSEVPNALKEFFRVLKPNGFVHIGLKMGETESLEKDVRYDGKEKYYAYYQIEEIRTMLQNTEFRTVESAVWSPKNDYVKHEVIFVLAQKN